MSWEDADDLVVKLTTAADAYDRPVAAEICDALVERVAATDEPFPDGPAKRVLNALRRKRWFTLMRLVAEAFNGSGVATFAVRRQYAQALIDSEETGEAETALTALVAATAEARREHTEARGLLGRTYKQMYIDGGASDAGLLRRSIDAYLEVYEEDPERNYWHGINVVALLERGQRDGVPLKGYPDPAQIARTMLRRIKARHSHGEASLWEFGTAVEATLALEDTSGALEWLGRYVASPSDSFELSSTLRQLTEVWQLAPEGDSGAMLEVLRAAILGREDGGSVTVELQAHTQAKAAIESVPGPTLERILGPTGVKTLKWYQMGLDRTQAVALISSAGGSGSGTGFLLSGSDLSEHLPADEMFVVTNAHVVAIEHEVDGTMFPEDAIITFEAVEDDTDEYTVTELVWSSPPSALDCSVLRLDKPPPEVPRIPVTPRLPTADGTQRVYIIGHPLGGKLSLSLQDNFLLDHESPDGAKVHYRTPTEPGSSGSPVFNSQWKLVALHHAGSMEMPKLEGGGTYAANEGLWIQKIREALTSHLAGV